MFKKLLPALLFLLAFTFVAYGQEVEVDKFTINARVDTAASAVDVRAQLAVANLGASPKPKLYLRLTNLAKVSAATVNQAAAQMETTPDRRTPSLNQITITPTAPLAPSARATVEVTYRIEVPESTAVAAVYAGEVIMLPELVWVPLPSTLFTLYGPTTAPFTLTVTFAPGSKLRAASAGAARSEGQTFTFDQTQNSLPFFVASTYGQPFAAEHGGVKFEIYTQQGFTAQPNTAKRLSDEAARIIDFFTRSFGPPPSGASFRIISSARAGNIVAPGAIVLNQQVLRQETLDATTIERLADAIARIWTDGRVRIRGQEQRSAQGSQPAQKARGAALLRDSLPRYLAALYFEDRYGKQASGEMFSRLRWAYTPVAAAARDEALAFQTIARPTYTVAVQSKGPLVFRLLAETAGREKFVGVLRSLLAVEQTKVVTPEDFRAALVKATGPQLDTLFQQWVDSVIEPDLIIGVPQPSGEQGSQRVNIRNLGTGDVTVPVLAMTASGKQVTATATVPSEDLAYTDIQTTEKIDSVEVDPDKLLIQTNYDNDRKPVRTTAQTLLNESIIAFNKGQHAEAETKLREAARVDPKNSLVRAWLARTLAAVNKMDEAVKEANAAIGNELSAGGANAWAHITLGQIALARNQASEAVTHLRRAVIEAEEAPAQFASREALVKAERAANLSPQVEDSIRAFITQLDTLIKQPSSDKLFTVVTRNNLKRFVQGLTVTPPSSWTTEILRTEQLDADRVAIDVALKVHAGGRDQSGTALFIIHRVGGAWVLEDVQLFNVK